jgi:hypothetical protein
MAWCLRREAWDSFGRRNTCPLVTQPMLARDRLAVFVNMGWRVADREVHREAVLAAVADYFEEQAFRPRINQDLFEYWADAKKYNDPHYTLHRTGAVQLLRNRAGVAVCEQVRTHTNTHLCPPPRPPCVCPSARPSVRLSVHV